MLYDSRTTVSALVRRDAWQQAGGFCEQRDWQRYEDWDFWLRVLERGWQGALLPEELLWYRRHPSSSHTRNQRDDLIYRARLVVDHPSLYHRAFHDWARRVVREASMPTPARRWRWFGLYALLIARFAPRELPKTLLRPAFKSIGPAQQMYARRIAQLLRLSRAA
jgi:GT2 family glycosyltransferase